MHGNDVVVTDSLNKRLVANKNKEESKEIIYRLNNIVNKIKSKAEEETK